MVAILAAATLALQLDVGADAGLPCPAHAALTEALQRRSSAHTLGPAEAAFDFRAGVWRLELRREGRLLLRRALAVPPADCALLADTAALVIDRYFSQVRQPARPPRQRRFAALVAVVEPPRAPPSVAAIEPPPAPLLEEARAVLIPSIPAVIGQPEQLGTGLGLTISAGLAALDDFRPGLWLQVERQWRSGSATLLVIAGTADHDSGAVGDSQPQSALMALSLGPCFEMFVRACFAPFAGVRGELHSSQRTLHPESQLRLTPELGAVVSLERALPYRLHAGLSLLAGKILGEEAFDPAAPPQEIDYAMALRMGLSF